MKCLLLFILLLSSEAASRADLKLVDKWPTDEKACSDTSLRLTFDKPPVVGNTGKIQICRATDGTAVETIEMGAEKFVDRFGVTGGFQLRYTSRKSLCRSLRLSTVLLVFSGGC